jgi:hypothetical protein
VGKASAAARKKSRKRHRRLLQFEEARWGRGAKLPISNAMDNAGSRVPLYRNRDEKKAADVTGAVGTTQSDCLGALAWRF